MKYRTFLSTLILFLLFFNFGILMITVTTFKDMIRSSKDKSLGEHYFITSALVKDFDALTQRNVNIDNSLNELLRSYQYLSDDKKVRLVLYKNYEPVYADHLEIELDNSIAEVPEDGDRILWFKQKNEHTFVTVAGKLPNPYASYTLAYLYDMKEEVASWKHMKNILFLSGAFLSGILALFLLLLLNRIFKPLTQITQTSHDIAAGAYDTRLLVTGHDELSEMAQSFNHMADEIQCQMKELIQAADKKQQFIDNFAHELRTPLTAIYGYAEYIQKAAVSEEEKLSAINYIMSESRRMQTMAYQLYYQKASPTSKDIKKEAAAEICAQAIWEIFEVSLDGQEIKTGYAPATEGLPRSNWNCDVYVGGKLAYYVCLDSVTGDLLAVGKERTLKEEVSVAFDKKLDKNPKEYLDLARKTAEQLDVVHGKVKSVEYVGQGYNNNDPTISTEIIGENGEIALMSFSRYDKSILGINYSNLYKPSMEHAKKVEEEQRKKLEEKIKKSQESHKYEEPGLVIYEEDGDQLKETFVPVK